MLEKHREEARRKRKLVYDCDKAQVFGGCVLCGMGVRLSSAKDGCLPFVRVVRGVTTPRCQDCQQWDSAKEA